MLLTGDLDDPDLLAGADLHADLTEYLRTTAA